MAGAVRHSQSKTCDGTADLDDREACRRMTLMLLEQRGLPTPESAKSFSKRQPWA